MKDLDIGNDTTLCFQDNHGLVEIYTCPDGQPTSSRTVSFEVLEKWVASIREQIITSSNEQANDCIHKACNIYLSCTKPTHKCCYTPPVG